VVVGFTTDLLLISSSFFLRILANEKAETLGPVLKSVFGTTVSAFGGFGTVILSSLETTAASGAVTPVFTT
jgi:hypothetical protein